jgi:hypothetical protein
MRRYHRSSAGTSGKIRQHRKDKVHNMKGRRWVRGKGTNLLIEGTKLHLI